MDSRTDVTLHRVSKLRHGWRFHLEGSMPIKQSKLGDLAHVRSGHTFKGALADDPDGTVRVLQIKDLRQRTVIDPDVLVTVAWEGSKTPPFLMPGEIVVVARGDSNNAALYKGGQSIVATSQLFIVSPQTDKISPEYLCWMINLPQSQRSLERNGSSILAISKASLMSMPIPLPSPDTQQKLAQLQQLWDEEDYLIAQLRTNREQMLQGIYQHLIKD